MFKSDGCKSQCKKKAKNKIKTKKTAKRNNIFKQNESKKLNSKVIKCG